MISPDEAFPGITYYKSRPKFLNWTLEQLINQDPIDAARYILGLPDKLDQESVTARYMRLSQEWLPELYPENHELARAIRSYIDWAYKTIYVQVFNMNPPAVQQLPRIQETLQASSSVEYMPSHQVTGAQAAQVISPGQLEQLTGDLMLGFRSIDQFPENLIQALSEHLSQRFSDYRSLIQTGLAPKDALQNWLLVHKK